MPMSYEAKEVWAKELGDRVRRAKAGLVASYQGLTVAEVMEIRREFRAASAEYRVVKNTLMQRIIAGTPIEKLNKAFTNTTAVAFMYVDEYAKLGRAAKELTKKFPKLEVKAGFVGSDVIGDASAVERFASLPTLDEARAQLLGVINAPAQRLLAQFNAPGQQLASVVDQQRQKLEGK